MKTHVSVDPALVEECMSRVFNVLSLTAPSAGSLEVEYSALISAAAILIALDRGTPRDAANLSRLGRRIFELVATELEDHVPSKPSLWTRLRKGAQANGI
jgi:hypothetical protein